MYRGMGRGELDGWVSKWKEEEGKRGREEGGRQGVRRERGSK